jgi:hypothetical protein
MEIRDFFRNVFLYLGLFLIALAGLLLFSKNMEIIRNLFILLSGLASLLIWIILVKPEDDNK